MADGASNTLWVIPHFINNSEITLHDHNSLYSFPPPTHTLYPVVTNWVTYPQANPLTSGLPITTNLTLLPWTVLALSLLQKTAWKNISPTLKSDANKTNPLLDSISVNGSVFSPPKSWHACVVNLLLFLDKNCAKNSSALSSPDIPDRLFW